MGKSYQRKTRRSRRKLQDLQNRTVMGDVAKGKATFQMVLPMRPLLSEVAGAIEQTATQAGLLMMKALIDEEVEQIAGVRYGPPADRQATRGGQDEGHVMFCGRKVAVRRPRVRSVEGHEVPLPRYQAFAHPERREEAVSQRILRRVSTRDYAGVLDDVCDGYGIQKSSVSRHWKAASRQQRKEMRERPLGDLDLCVLFLDGKEFHDFTLIAAEGPQEGGRQPLRLPDADPTLPGAQETQHPEVPAEEVPRYAVAEAEDGLGHDRVRHSTPGASQGPRLAGLDQPGGG